MARSKSLGSDPTMSLMDKWRQHAKTKKKNRIELSPNTWGPILYVYTIGFGTLWGVVKVLPDLYSDDWSSWLLPMRVVLTLLGVQVALNWCGLRFVRSQYSPLVHGTKPADFPDVNTIKKMTSAEGKGDGTDKRSGKTTGGKSDGIEKGLRKTNQDSTRKRDTNSRFKDQNKNGGQSNANKSSSAHDGYSFTVYVATALPTKEGGKVERTAFPYWSWVPCLMCQKLRPPRCHHCTYCKQCVLKRDHHCYFSGTCVGVNNTRFFYVFLLWSFLLTSFGMVHLPYYYLYYMMPAYNLSYLDIIFPITLIRGVFGFISLTVAPLSLVILCIAFCNVFSLFMMAAQVKLCLTGKTSFELDNGIEVCDTRSTAGKLRGVFGHYWWLNVFFPTYLRFKAEEDAVLWPHVKPRLGMD